MKSLRAVVSKRAFPFVDWMLRNNPTMDVLFFVGGNKVIANGASIVVRLKFNGIYI